MSAGQDCVELTGIAWRSVSSAAGICLPPVHNGLQPPIKNPLRIPERIFSVGTVGIPDGAYSASAIGICVESVGWGLSPTSIRFSSETPSER